ncbi:hypothetical protein [Adhaeribacter aquaticus]|uniref:hypothetical protein n=1 Tax=Adhaeribacter aquaticus TaxID=299567 RepID=UPI001FDF46F9|nr:hypothetical protein [Adhaeribacter aquaticus]
MKKIFFGSGLVLALLGTAACERTNKAESADAEDSKTRVVQRDSVATEYEVTETVVEYDTTQRTKTVKADVQNDKDVIKVKKDRD